MAAFVYIQFRHRRLLRRNRIFRDRTHPLEVFDDAEVLTKFRMPRHAIFDLTDSVYEKLKFYYRRQGSLAPVLQVCLTLRFYATGTFQDAVGEMIGVDQATVSRTITRVTDAFVEQMNQYIRMPDQREAESTKIKFYEMQRIPNVIGCIDGTHVRIQAPSENEHEFVNRKNFHSINVQVVCNSDLIFINVVAKWPGSVHDSRILRQSRLFADFEGPRPSVDGILLGDSGYMLRDWLLTPVLHPATREERLYNFAHSSTRTTVERSIGVAKQRWQCLRVGLRVKPVKACKIIVVCLMLHNRARLLNIPIVYDDQDMTGAPTDVAENDPDLDGEVPEQPSMSERARFAAGQAVRRRIINGLM